MARGDQSVPLRREEQQVSHLRIVGLVFTVL